MLDLVALLALALLLYGTAPWSLVLLVLWALLRHFWCCFLCSTLALFVLHWRSCFVLLALAPLLFC